MHVSTTNLTRRRSYKLNAYTNVLTSSPSAN
ncbi:unnamed protein product, partial [Rotaria magnacalcarata]